MQGAGAAETAEAILLIEYRVEDFPDWRQMFHRDPLDRRSHGAVGHAIYQDADDPNHLLLSLQFPSADAARTFRDLPAFQAVWELSGAGRSWVLE